MIEDPDREPDGKFKVGNQIKTDRQIPSHFQRRRKEIRMAFIDAVYKLLKTPETGEAPKDDGSLNKFDYLVQHAVYVKNYKFIEYAINQSIGKPVQPVAAKVEGSTTPTTVIRRLDGSTIEYKIEDKSAEE